MANPLNPSLFRQLQRVFGHVRIQSEGEKMIARYIKHPVTGLDTLDVTNAGEEYLVCCPKCNDTRFRLSINHLWGHRDQLGRRNLWMANCYNEHCYSNQLAREELFYDLTEIDGVLENARIIPGVEVVEAKETKPPGPIKLLHELPMHHAANAYLAGRFYDPERLGKFYGVGYCEQSVHWLARNRIYVPVYDAGVLKGWQVRYIGEMDWKAETAPPKWWTDPAMKKRFLLYNLDQARKYRTGVIGEGCADVWSFGPMSVATFGSSMSMYQRRLFVSNFKNGSGVLLYDPDVQEDPVKLRSYQRLVEHLSKPGLFRHGFAAVTLPTGTDPGGLDRGYLRSYVAREAKASRGESVVDTEMKCYYRTRKENAEWLPGSISSHQSGTVISLQDAAGKDVTILEHPSVYFGFRYYVLSGFESEFVDSKFTLRIFEICHVKPRNNKP